MNKIQFQTGMSLHEFIRHYGKEEQCEAALFATREGKGDATLYYSVSLQMQFCFFLFPATTSKTD